MPVDFLAELPVLIRDFFCFQVFLKYCFFSYFLLGKPGFSISDINKVDNLRKQRNNIKYYRRFVSKKEAEKAIKIAEQIMSKLKKIIDEKEKKLKFKSIKKF